MKNYLCVPQEFFDVLNTQRKRHKTVIRCISSTTEYFELEVHPGVFDFKGVTAEACATFLFSKRQNIVNMRSVLVDLGCGSGIAGLSLMYKNPVKKACFLDIETQAVANAQANIKRLQKENHLQMEGIQCLKSDLFSSFPTELRGCVDVLVFNQPFFDEQSISDRRKDWIEKAIVAHKSMIRNAVLETFESVLKPNGIMIMCFWNKAHHDPCVYAKELHLNCEVKMLPDLTHGLHASGLSINFITRKQ